MAPEESAQILATNTGAVPKTEDGVPVQLGLNVWFEAHNHAHLGVIGSLYQEHPEGPIAYSVLTLPGSAGWYNQPIYAAKHLALAAVCRRKLKEYEEAKAKMEQAAREAGIENFVLDGGER